MKRNIKTVGLLALLVGGLLMSFAIPAMAVTPPWMLCDAGREDGRGGGGGDPRIAPILTCYLGRASVPTEGEPFVEDYYQTCSPCGEYVFGIPMSSGACDPEKD